MIATVLANIAIPIIFFNGVLMLIAFIPVVVFEGMLLARFLQREWTPSLLASLKANFLSTLLGVPVAWFIMGLLKVGVQEVIPKPDTTQFIGKVLAITTHGPSLVGIVRTEGWMIVGAVLLAFLTALWASVLVEYWFLRRKWVTSGERPALKKAVIIGNLVSYAGLILFVVIRVSVGG